jgi:hypothetical protein
MMQTDAGRGLVAVVTGATGATATTLAQVTSEQGKPLVRMAVEGLEEGPRAALLARVRKVLASLSLVPCVAPCRVVRLQLVALPALWHQCGTVPVAHSPFPPTPWQKFDIADSGIARVLTRLPKLAVTAFVTALHEHGLVDAVACVVLAGYNATCDLDHEIEASGGRERLRVACESAMATLELLEDGEDPPVTRPHKRQRKGEEGEDGEGHGAGSCDPDDEACASASACSGPCPMVSSGHDPPAPSAEPGPSRGAVWGTYPPAHPGGARSVGRPPPWAICAQVRTDGIRLLVVLQRAGAAGAAPTTVQGSPGRDPGWRLDRRKRQPVVGKGCGHEGHADWHMKRGLFHADAVPRGSLHLRDSLPPTVAGGCFACACVGLWWPPVTDGYPVPACCLVCSLVCASSPSPQPTAVSAFLRSFPTVTV